MSDVLELDEARAAGLGAELSDAALQAALDEEEAWLARRIGPLLGEREQRFPLAYMREASSVLVLQRPTDAVEITSDGTALTDFELRPGGWRVAQLPEATRWGGVLVATYTPNDELEVRRALKELVGVSVGAQAAGGLQGETMGSYSYQRGAGTTTRTRASIVRGLREPVAASTMRVSSSVRHGLAGALER